MLFRPPIYVADGCFEFNRRNDRFIYPTGHLYISLIYLRNPSTPPPRRRSPLAFAASMNVISPVDAYPSRLSRREHLSAVPVPALPTVIPRLFSIFHANFSVSPRQPSPIFRLLTRTFPVFRPSRPNHSVSRFSSGTYPIFRLDFSVSRNSTMEK